MIRITICQSSYLHKTLNSETWKLIDRKEERKRKERRKGREEGRKDGTMEERIEGQTYVF